MDPISQGITGSLATMTLPKKKKKEFLALFVIGFLSGMAPDLDILIRSNTDPLLSLEYHRQFTHSLIFIPIGGLICALIFHIKTRKYFKFTKTYFACTLGYATHGLLDSCTSYGTLLFWPFSDYRVAFNIISIIDPLYTLPLIILLIIACIRKSKKFINISLVWAFLYFSFGAIQNYRATEHLNEIAKSRGHTPSMITAKPSFANLILWRTIYLYDGYFYTDAVHLSSNKSHIEGSKIKKLNLQEDLPDIPLNSRVAKDIKRFNWFSSNYTALDPKRKNYIVDIRYSLLPNKTEGLWGIKLPDNYNNHVDFLHFEKMNKENREKFRNMLLKN